MVKKLAAALATVLLTVSVALGGVWEDTCKIFAVDPNAVLKPQVTRSRLTPQQSGMYGIFMCHIGERGYIVLYDDDPRVLAHEYAHAIMYSTAFQEMMAEWAEQELFGSVYDGTN